MNSAQLKEKIIMMKNKSEKYDKLNIQNQELIHTNNILQDNISLLVGEIDDFKVVIHNQKNTISLLNQEINGLEEQLDKSQQVNLELHSEKDEYVEFSIDLKDRVHDLNGFSNLYHEKCIEIEKLTSQLNKLMNENNDLKLSLALSQSSNNNLFKSFIDELGVSEWDIVNKDETNDENCT